MNWKATIYGLCSGTIISIVINGLIDTLLTAQKSEPLSIGSSILISFCINIAILGLLAAIGEIVKEHTKKS